MAPGYTFMNDCLVGAELDIAKANSTEAIQAQTLYCLLLK
jgi:hypothetical protein